jgi:hypothetical protein
MKFKVSVLPKIDDTILIKTDMYDENDKLAGEFIQQIIDLKDQAVRDALIQFGWIPPDKKIKCPYCKMEYDAVMFTL